MIGHIKRKITSMRYDVVAKHLKAAFSFHFTSQQSKKFKMNV